MGHRVYLAADLVGAEDLHCNDSRARSRAPPGLACQPIGVESRGDPRDVGAVVASGLGAGRCGSWTYLHVCAVRAVEIGEASLCDNLARQEWVRAVHAGVQYRHREPGAVHAAQCLCKICLHHRDSAGQVRVLALLDDHPGHVFRPLQGARCVPGDRESDIRDRLEFGRDLVLEAVKMPDHVFASIVDLLALFADRALVFERALRREPDVELDHHVRHVPIAFREHVARRSRSDRQN